MVSRTSASRFHLKWFLTAMTVYATVTGRSHHSFVSKMNASQIPWLNRVSSHANSFLFPASHICAMETAEIIQGRYCTIRYRQVVRKTRLDMSGSRFLRFFWRILRYRPQPVGTAISGFVRRFYEFPAGNQSKKQFRRFGHDVFRSSFREPGRRVVHQSHGLLCGSFRSLWVVEVHWYGYLWEVGGFGRGCQAVTR